VTRLVWVSYPFVETERETTYLKLDGVLVVILVLVLDLLVLWKCLKDTHYSIIRAKLVSRLALRAETRIDLLFDILLFSCPQ